MFPPLLGSFDRLSFTYLYDLPGWRQSVRIRLLWLNAQYGGSCNSEEGGGDEDAAGVVQGNHLSEEGYASRFLSPLRLLPSNSASMPTPVVLEIYLEIYSPCNVYLSQVDVQLLSGHA